MEEMDQILWEGHHREHEMEQKALEVARAEIERRLEGMNELRAQITSERGNYIARAEFEAKHEQITQRLGSLETLQAGVLSRLTVVAALAGVAVSVIVSVVLKLVNV